MEAESLSEMLVLVPLEQCIQCHI